MSLMPVLCPSCRRTQLAITAVRGDHELPACNLCGGKTRLVPSCSFGLADRELFEELSEIIAHGRITTIEAEVLALEAQRALWAGAYRRLLDILTTRLPGLLPIHIAVENCSDGQRKLLSVSRTIFEALTTLRTTPASA